MNARIFSIIAAVACAMGVAAAPYGHLSCSLQTATDCRILEINVGNGSNWTVISGPLIRYGIDAVPDLGRPCVVHKGGPQGIEELYSSGSRRTVVAIASSGTNVDPCVSHDGTTMAYVQHNTLASSADVLHIVDLDSLSNTSLFDTGVSGDDLVRPRFSADGQSILFGREGTIQRIAVTGGAQSVLAALPPSAMHPCVAPDGTMMACVANNGGTFEPYVANADGSSPRHIDLGGEFALYPCFSPDSRYLATCSDNGINIIDLGTDQVVQQIPLDYEGYYGLCWHMGASRSYGTVTKMKVAPKKMKIKVRGLGLSTAVDFALLKVDQVVLPLNSTGLWTDKKGKKYMYKNKELGLKAKLVVKNGKGSFSAKGLSLVEGDDYHVGQPIPVTVHVTRESVLETLTLDAKGKYKAPKD